MNMNMKKWILVLVFALLMSFSYTSCTNDDEPEYNLNECLAYTGYDRIDNPIVTDMPNGTLKIEGIASPKWGFEFGQYFLILHNEGADANHDYKEKFVGVTISGDTLKIDTYYDTFGHTFWRLPDSVDIKATIICKHQHKNNLKYNYVRYQ